MERRLTLGSPVILRALFGLIGILCVPCIFLVARPDLSPFAVATFP